MVANVGQMSQNVFAGPIDIQSTGKSGISFASILKSMSKSDTLSADDFKTAVYEKLAAVLSQN